MFKAKSQLTVCFHDDQILETDFVCYVFNVMFHMPVNIFTICPYQDNLSADVH